MTAIPLPQHVRQEIPMNDLRRQHAQIGAEIEMALSEVIDGCNFILGPQVERFEAAFAAYCRTEHCVGVSSGTDALRLALQATGIGPGDEVITTPLTFGATLEAIFQVGARPVLVDIDPQYYTMDPQHLHGALSARTRAILPVHLYGQMTDMKSILALAAERDLVVIEDAAQAHGARYNGAIAGGVGRVGCFSFYPGKNLGAYGDAGGITTNDDVLAERVRRLRNHGQAKGDKFNYLEVGGNYRMDGMQGAVLEVKLRHLEAWNEHRRMLAARYCTLLAGLEAVGLPDEASYAHHVYHLYALRVPDREDLATSLRAEGVETAVQYPHPLHLTPAFAGLGYRRGDFPVCEQICSELLSVPLFADMTEDQVDYVVDAIFRHYT
ncbi:MAG: DegT/DnrJ/EryC1/StrS family aminotransferase [Candidatus Latescibacterota bacterium]|jgi:dTDP-4-amino-4,6-dideoxygalactose transaminase